MKTILDTVEKFEDGAIKIGDLARAIKYNWLRNAVESGIICDTDEIVEKALLIHADGWEMSQSRWTR